MAPAVVWFRRDLRLDDHPALAAAASATPDGVVPLFVLDPNLLDHAGPNRRRFLAESLDVLDRALGGTLVLRRGDPTRVVPSVATEAGATLVTCTADFAPYGRARDRAVAAALVRSGARLLSVGSPYAVDPGTVRAASGGPFRVFTPFRRAWEAIGWPPPEPEVDVRFVGATSDASVEDLRSEPCDPHERCLPEWWQGLSLGTAAHLPPAGPAAAWERLERFVAAPLASYATDRDRPGLSGTSGLSAHLRFGCIHPRTVLEHLGSGSGAERMRSELAWREFHADVLWHRPDSARRPLQPFGDHLRWDVGEQAHERFQAWAAGATGYPLVDAGMRQLLAEGWMHNRVRMVTASFLVKDLHIDWRWGARWFMWHLVDGDLASNQHGWQWVAGTGTDAAPFHRVLNPVTQQERFDPDGDYVRRYVGDPTPLGHEPIVDHRHERREALARFDEARHRARIDQVTPSSSSRRPR